MQKSLLFKVGLRLSATWTLLIHFPFFRSMTTFRNSQRCPSNKGALTVYYNPCKKDKVNMNLAV